MNSPEARPRLEEPSREQREQAAAARVGGLMKPGQGEGHWRRLLLLEGVAEDRLDHVLEQARQQHRRQVARRQGPLRPLAESLVAFGVLGVLALPVMLVFERSLVTIGWGAAFLVAGLFLIGRGLRLRRLLRVERDLGMDLEQTSLYRQKSSAAERLDEARRRVRHRDS